MKIKAEVREESGISHSSGFSRDQLADFIFFSNFGVGLCTAGAALLYFLSSNVEISLPCLVFIFCATTFIYNLDRFNTSNEDWLNAPERSLWVKQNSVFILQINIVLFSVILWIMTASLSWPVFLISLMSLALCLFYKFKLKKYPAMKNITVAAVWSNTVCVIPALWSNGDLSSLNIAVLLFCFGAALLNTIFFDLKDLKGDQYEKIQSIPVLLGYTRSKQVLILMAFSLIIACLVNKHMLIFTIVPAGYLLLDRCRESRVKYLIADLLLAAPLIFWI